LYVLAAASSSSFYLPPIIRLEIILETDSLLETSFDKSTLGVSFKWNEEARFSNVN
jgi:hypothetical protein